MTSARLDHEQLTARETAAPHRSLVNASYNRTVPRFGIDCGNDFGSDNSTQRTVSQGYRPVR